MGMKVSKEMVEEALKKVIDPELGFDIVALGLIYKVEVDERNNVKIEMTLTSPGCPLMPVINEMINTQVGKIEGVGKIDLDLVWDPPWVMDMISEEVKAELGL